MTSTSTINQEQQFSVTGNFADSETTVVIQSQNGFEFEGGLGTLLQDTVTVNFDVRFDYDVSVPSESFAANLAGAKVTLNFDLDSWGLDPMNFSFDWTHIAQYPLLGTYNVWFFYPWTWFETTQTPGLGGPIVLVVDGSTLPGAGTLSGSYTISGTIDTVQVYTDGGTTDPIDQPFQDVDQEKSDAQTQGQQDISTLNILNADLAAAQAKLQNLDTQAALQTAVTIGQGLKLAGDVAEIGLTLLAPEIALPYALVKGVLKAGADSQDVVNSLNTLSTNPNLTNFNSFVFNVDNWLIDAFAFKGVMGAGFALANLLKDATDFDEALRSTPLSSDVTLLNASITELQGQISAIETQEAAAEALDPNSGPPLVAIAIDPHLVQAQGAQGNLDGLIGAGWTLLLTQKGPTTPTTNETILTASSAVEGISLLDQFQTVVVDDFGLDVFHPGENAIRAVIEGNVGGNNTVTFTNPRSAYAVQYSATGVEVRNDHLDVLIQNVSTVNFSDEKISFDSAGQPHLSRLPSAQPSVGHIFNPTQGPSAIVGFDQPAFFDPLQNDKVHFASTATPANSGNYIAVQDIASTYAGAVTVANELLKQYSYVLIGYDQGASDGSTSPQPAAGQNFLLLFADLSGQHHADATVRLTGLDDISQFSPSFIATDGTPAILSAAGAISAYSANQNVLGLAIQDSDANVLASLDSLEAIKSSISNIVVTHDSGQASMSLSTTQYVADLDVIYDMTSAYDLTLTFSAAAETISAPTNVGSPFFVLGHGGHLGGNDTILGDNKHDTIIFSSASPSTGIVVNAAGYVDISNLTQDILIKNVEFLHFTDKIMFVENADNSNIARLYSAALDRAPDTGGLSGWDDIYANNISASTKAGGVYLALAQTGDGFGTSIAGGFAQSAEFQNKYGALNDSGFVTQLYLNVLNRVPAPTELNAWLGLMHNSGFTHDMVLVGFAESPENIAKTAADWLIQI
jgi:Domain of unknown function (DUF4214)